jgi:hypothetical protein
VEVLLTAVYLIIRSMVLSAQSAGQQRLLWLKQTAAVGGDVGEAAWLREENRRLKSGNRMLKARLDDAPSRKRYTPVQRLQIPCYPITHRARPGRDERRFVDGMMDYRGAPSSLVIRGPGDGLRGAAAPADPQSVPVRGVMSGRLHGHLTRTARSCPVNQ